MNSELEEWNSWMVSAPSDPKRGSYLCSLLIAVSLICSVYFVGSAFFEKQYKESEVSSWIPPPGQDISSLQQLSSFYHLHPQGQHLTFSPQAGLAAFPAIYPPVQTAAAPSTVNQLTQQP